MGYKSAFGALGKLPEAIAPTPARLAPGFFSVRALLVIIGGQFLDRDRRGTRPRLPQPHAGAFPVLVDEEHARRLQRSTEGGKIVRDAAAARGDRRWAMTWNALAGLACKWRSQSLGKACRFSA